MKYPWRLNVCGNWKYIVYDSAGPQWKVHKLVMSAVVIGSKHEERFGSMFPTA